MLKSIYLSHKDQIYTFLWWIKYYWYIKWGKFKIDYKYASKYWEYSNTNLFSQFCFQQDSIVLILKVLICSGKIVYENNSSKLLLTKTMFKIFYDQNYVNIKFYLLIDEHKYKCQICDDYCQNKMNVKTLQKITKCEMYGWVQLTYLNYVKIEKCKLICIFFHKYGT